MDKEIPAMSWLKRILKGHSLSNSQGRLIMDKEIPAMLWLKRILKGHSDRIYRLAWSPDGVILATPSRDCSVKLWNAETGELLYSINEPSHVNCVAWSPDGSRLAIGGDNNLIQVWDVSNKCEILRMDGVFGTYGSFMVTRWTIACFCYKPFVTNLGYKYKKIILFFRKKWFWRSSSMCSLVSGWKYVSNR